MKRIYYFSVFHLFLFITLNSCNSVKKLNYAQAYKFRNTENINGPLRSIEDHVDSLFESSDKASIDNPGSIAPLIPNRVPFSKEKSIQHKNMHRSEIKKEIKGLSIEERRNLRNELRASLKDLKKERKLIKNSSGKEQMQMTYLVKGLLLLIGGFVLIVAGILLINPAGLVLGSIIAGIGLIVFLIGLLGLIL